MPASTSVKYYVSSNTSAPQLTNAWGVMIDVLDACLVTGFSSQTVSSLVASGTTVTATFGTAHNYLKYQVVEISGASQSYYNGQFRILSVPSTTTLTFELASTPVVTTATGTISCKLPALGFEKKYSGTQKAVYRSQNVTSSRMFLRVDNSLDPVYTTTWAKYAKVTVADSMTDVDTFNGIQAPYDAASPNKNHVGTGTAGNASTIFNGWAKWYYARINTGSDSSTPANGNMTWIIVGDDRGFFFIPHHSLTTGNAGFYGFQEFNSFIPSDTFNYVLFSDFQYANANTSKTAGTTAAHLAINSGAAFGVLAVNYTLSGNYTTVGCRSLGINFTNSDNASGFSSLIVAPSISYPLIVQSDIYLLENLNVFRGKLTGVKWLFQNLPYSNFEAVNVGTHYYVAAQVQANNVNNISYGECLFDLGDWR